MSRLKTLANLMGLASVAVSGKWATAQFSPPITADPANTYIATIGTNYNQAQTFSEPIGYDADFNRGPDVYWFKYVSDGKTAITFDTLGSNFTNSVGGYSLPTTNESQIAVYTSAGKPVGLSRNVVDSTGNPIEIAKFFNEPEPPPQPLSSHPDYYYAEGLSQVTFAPNPATDPRWAVNPNDPTPYMGWTAPDNPGNGQNYASPAYYTSLNEYHVWSTSLGKYVINNDGSTYQNSSGVPYQNPGWRYGDYANGGLASTWNQYRALPAGTYFIAVAGANLTFSGDTYHDLELQAPIHYDYNGSEPNNGNLPITTQPLGTFQYYDDPTAAPFSGTIQLNVTESAATVQYQWLNDASGNWSTAGNWAGTVPHLAGDYANFLSTNTAPRTITLDAPESVGHLIFDSANQYMLAGSKTLTLDNGSSPADVIVNTGNHVIAAPLAVASSATIIAYASTGLSITGNLSIGPGQTLTKLGFGGLTISGPQSNGLGSALYIGEGTAAISTDPGSNVALTSAATVTFPAGTTTGIRPIHLASLTITTQGLVNGTVTLAGPGSHNESKRTVLVTSGLTFTGTSSLGWIGTLDLGGNDAIVHNGNLPNILSQFRSEYTNGSWQGSSGITSSAASSDTTNLTVLGIIPNNSGLYTAFDGQSTAISDVLIKYTYYGDTNLDGKVDGSDYSRIDNGFVTNASGWLNGDFNYDGVVNGSDYTLIDNAFNTQGAAITSVVATPTTLLASSSVPEPANLALLSSAMLAMLSRRRKA